MEKIKMWIARDEGIYDEGIEIDKNSLSKELQKLT